MSTADRSKSTVEEGRWIKYEPGETVLEFGRAIVAVNGRGARVIASQFTADYRPTWIFMLPRLPKREEVRL